MQVGIAFQITGPLHSKLFEDLVVELMLDHHLDLPQRCSIQLDYSNLSISDFVVTVTI